jgi:hypothetical protein
MNGRLPVADPNYEVFPSMTFLPANPKQERIAAGNSARRNAAFLPETGLGLNYLDYPLRL